jgi:menaquinone-specific isochorismate synthase
MNANSSPTRAWSSVENPASLVPEGRLVSYSVSAPNLTAATFLRHARGQPRFYWHSHLDEVIYAGFGVANQLVAWGADRFTDIERRAKELFQDAAVLSSHDVPILPRLFGGFSFRDDFVQDNTWASFHPAHFVLPHYQFVQHGHASYLTINAVAAADDDSDLLREQLQAALIARINLLNEAPPPGAGNNDLVAIRYPMTRVEWGSLIEVAQEQMKHTALEKVVLARVCELQTSHIVDVDAILDFLETEFSDCTRFLFEPRPYHAFYGATPERLVRKEDQAVITMALAGSRPRGDTTDHDAKLAQELLHDGKERHEHELVVETLRRRLQQVTASLEVPDEPAVYPLSYIQHLYTPISGALVKPATILSLVALLHPTPALGGSPRDRAMAFIQEREPVPRGWYAAPVGWFDSEMNGDFAVAIRSAVAQEQRIWCYAGAGIVSASQAETEWAETELKFRPMLTALGASQVSLEEPGAQPRHE